MEHERIISETIGGEYVDLGMVSGGLSDSYKRKIVFSDKEWMVKICSGTPLRKSWYEELKKLACPQIASPQMIGLFDNGTLCLVSPWINGDALDNVLLCAPTEAIKDYSVQAANIMAQLHHTSIKYPGLDEAIKKRLLLVCDEVERLQLSFPGHKEFCSFLRSKSTALDVGNICLLHKDVRPENFIVCDGKLSLIDFDNGGLGEAESDFVYLTTMGDISHRRFSKEVIKHYLSICNSESFWEKNLVYSVMQVMEYAVWKYKTKGKQMRLQAENLLTQYDGLGCVVPKWFNDEVENNDKL